MTVWRRCWGTLCLLPRPYTGLDRFHEEQLLADRPVQGSCIPPESRWLPGLRSVAEHSMHTSVTALQPGPAVTLEVAPHLVGSSKAEALRTYEGFRGYQPILVSWAEQHLVLALAPQAWQFWGQEADGGVREWAEAPFVPAHQKECRDAQPYRCLAIRVRQPQERLFRDGNQAKRFAVASNDWGTEGQALVAWRTRQAGEHCPGAPGAAR